MANSNDLAIIELDSNWKCYYQSFNDKPFENIMISTANNSEINQRWTSLDLPHITATSERSKHEEMNSYQWWYCKQFNGIPTDKQSKQQLHLTFRRCDGSNNNSISSNTTGTIWLNDTQIFSGLLMQLSEPLELPANLLHGEILEEDKCTNTLTICCFNSSLSLHARLILRGKVIIASGQVNVDEELVNNHQHVKKTDGDILDYTVSVDNDDGRIDVIFNSKKKCKAPLTQLSELTSHEKQIDENKPLKNDLFVPRLAIVILIVGTRGDVQPFIA